MHWHAHIQGKEGIDNPEDAARFGKYGISAGVELGNLNRYKNIFPVRYLYLPLPRSLHHVTDA